VGGDKSSRGEAARGASEPGIAQGPASPFPAAWQGAEGLGSPLGFNGPWSPSAAGSCSCLLELLHATFPKHLWVWFSTALLYPRLPNPDQRT